MEDWAEKIQAIKKKGCWTQVELAWKMGVSTNSIRKWEKGSEPSMKVKKKIEEMCKELKIDDGRDEEIMRFIYILMSNIPTRKLNDERMHVWDMKENKDCGTLKEYIGERMMALFGVTVEYGEDTNK